MTSQTIEDVDFLVDQKSIVFTNVLSDHDCHCIGTCHLKGLLWS